MGTSYKLSDKQVHAIRRLYALGASKDVLAAAVGVTDQTIRHHVSKPGDVVPANRRERQRGVTYKPRQPKAEPVKTTSLAPITLAEARQALDIVQHQPKRGLFARIFGT